MHVLDMILFWARVRPNYPALIQTDMIISYKALAEAIFSVSERIGQLGFEAGEPVAVSIEHPAKRLATIFALLLHGLTPVPIVRNHLPFLHGAGIDNVIYVGEGQVLSGGRNVRFDDSWLRRTAAPSKISEYRQAGVYPGIVFFSSGTTGAPKKYIHSYEGFVERLNTTVLRETAEYSRALVLPGLASSFGFTHVCELLHFGKTVCFSLPGEMMFSLINSHRIEAVFASPQQALGLVDLIEKDGVRYQIDSLKSVRIAGGLVSKELVRRIQADLCPQVTIIYGSTEAGVLAFAAYDVIGNVANAVGHVLPWVELEIVDETGAVLPPGEEGFIRCRTPIYVKNFAANNPDANVDPRDVWWYPGDIGRRTKDGVLCVSGRSGDVINRGGHKVSAAVLEGVVQSYPGVKDAGICSIMGDSGITELWIAVVPKTAIDIAKLQQSLEADDAFNTKIDGIVIADNIPRNDLGKIKRHELSEKLVSMKKRSTS